jgi:dUTP pyrophosphatase
MASRSEYQQTTQDQKVEEIPLQVKKFVPHAILPQRATEGSAGYDLFSTSEQCVPARGKAMISTGIGFTVPHGTYGRLAPRSGLAWKNSIDVGAGIIDADYTLEVKVILFNHSDIDYHISSGDRIAQLILEKNATPPVVEVTELQVTKREGGFGSTGTSEFTTKKQCI